MTNTLLHEKTQQPSRIETDRRAFHMEKRFEEFGKLTFHRYEADFESRLTYHTKVSGPQAQADLTEEQFATLERKGVVRTETAIYAGTAEKMWDERVRWIDELRAKRAAEKVAA